MLIVNLLPTPITIARLTWNRGLSASMPASRLTCTECHRDIGVRPYLTGAIHLNEATPRIVRACEDCGHSRIIISTGRVVA
jgi:RNase P subunit RPR2